MMLSNADNWEFSYTGLATQLGIRRETVKTRVQGLIDKGYVSVSYPTGENGKPLPFAKGVWEIREEPITSAGFSGTRKPAHMCPISSHEDLDTKEQALNFSHEDLDTKERTQRTTAGTKGVLLQKKYQMKEYQGENHHLQKQEEMEEMEEEDPSTPFNETSSSNNGSEAKASPLPNKSQGDSGAVMPEREFEFQQFLKKYPKKPTGTDMESTRKAFFEATVVDGSFAEIMAGLDDWCNSVDWNKENGRYITKPLNFLTTRKWEEVPRTINTEIDPGLWRFIRPRDVEDYI
jgi:hypothetical protein